MTEGTGDHPEVLSFHRKWPVGITRRPKTHVLGRFSSYRAVTEVAVEGRQLALLVRLTSYRAVIRRRWQSRDRKGRHVTSPDRKLPGSGCRRPRTGIFGTFEFLQGCNSKQVVVTWPEMMSRDRKWRRVTLGDWKWPGSDDIWPEVGRKCPYKAENLGFGYIWAPTGL